MVAPSQMPSGMGMMMKALGLDPAMFGKVAQAVTEIAERLERIEQKLNAVLGKSDAGKNGNGNS